MQISEYFFPLILHDGDKLPEKFTFPFYYEPSKIALTAAADLQEYLEREKDNINHNFGFDPKRKDLIIGKMFGVLVVQKENGELGYLRAFSGKLANTNQIKGFVPPVFDMLKEDGYFREEEIILNQYTIKIAAYERTNKLKALRVELEKLESEAISNINDLKANIRIAKAERKEQRSNLNDNIAENLEILRKQSIKEQYHLKDQNQYWRTKIAELKNRIQLFDDDLNQLKLERSSKSNALQKRLFTEYAFLNYDGDYKSLHEIFDVENSGFPPAGSGECAAPKLLQFAYQNNLKPISLAEFWWGASPKSEIRIHKNFYPACRGKCEPILGHMLKGLEMDPNPIIEAPIFREEFEVIYEDDFILAINKPHEFLSVPGKVLKDSVQTRMEEKYKGEIFLVHRLDMSTSGILLIAKKQGIHKNLQHQFIKRLVKKKYTAVLDGVLTEEQGLISLPLRVDLEDRPRQLVCYEHGKKAETKWELIKIQDGKTWVSFYPKTGRTHQLRVHAAHKDGLSIPILGDDLYGKKSGRLFLHAEELEFSHPKTKEKIILKAPNNF